MFPTTNILWIGGCCVGACANLLCRHGFHSLLKLTRGGTGEESGKDKTILNLEH